MIITEETKKELKIKWITKEEFSMIFSRGNLIFIYSILLHLIWGVVLIFSATAIHTTAIDSSLKIFKYQNILALAYIFASILSMTFIILRSKQRIESKWGILLMMPQQLLMLFSSGGALQAVINSSFADGVIRSRDFIFIDQLPAILSVIVHTIGIFRLSKR